ncbi:PAS domain S-box-containing protein/diguanylate cyclase (GGDEF)-like protein [Tahibacter aquaticus]|uniref:PAS domain S-box-containing protein/diguanylate cyclase (GGDEF)-like protein n=1 Tax=Tahibacter aquaticus TaxID=520092 RepID=A0A4R6Z7D9_9GAMM|nr:GGDEF domain-containing protein [Tahibacter aquaticus]TDR47728.1 PAS domain S-box-containing protein/diguanylate cyclase (GGDEF)-like protein [Tahibacter aquaticus]
MLRPHRGLTLTALLCLAAWPSLSGADDGIPRHDLETRALLQPEAAMDEIAGEIERAQQRGDMQQLALLYLARANACRVIADWNCQREAGSRARDAAVASGNGILTIRGLIADSRGSIALQDFSRGEHLLGEAQRLLQEHPQPVLAADVYLAYSSLSYSLGKHALGVEYAERGLAALGSADEPAMRVRLLRNRARAEAQLGEAEKAQATLQQAQQALGTLNDPKLRAELYLETARMARSKNDVAIQRRSGNQVLELAVQLKNAQLAGLGHEVLGLAAIGSNEDDAAQELRLALDSFRRLNQNRDELRVLRELIPLEIRRRAPRGDVELLIVREVDLGREIDSADRAKSSADFDSRLKYAQSEIELARLKQEAILATERAAALAQTSRLTTALIVTAAIMLLVLAAFFIQQWRAKRRLQLAYEAYRESEGRYRMLADNSRDLVVRMRVDGRRLYVSPSAREMLGWAPEDLHEARWELVHPDDLDPLREAIGRLARHGGSASITYRAQHRDGHYVWIEALGQLVRADGDSDAQEIVYSGRDISARVEAEQALAESQRRLLAVTDNIPALIAQFDTQERYRFTNAFYRRAFDENPESMIGRTLREVRGEETYAVLRDYAAAALRGESVRFEGEIKRNGLDFQFQAHYVPDRAADGNVQGFFALTFDISALKQAQHELARLARHDSMTGVANRRHFDERLGAALARSRRNGQPLALLYLDIDYFKRINDSRGHRVGDEVIVEFARRLNASVRGEDLVARLGGDEFVILIDAAANPAAAEAIAAKLVATMRDAIVTSAGSVHVTTSIGIAYSTGGLDAIGLVALADQALYAAKTAGRDTYRLRTSDGTAGDEEKPVAAGQG